MRISNSTAGWSLLSLVTLAALAPGTEAPPDWTKKLEDIARTYTAFERADRFYRFSPFDCRAPGPTPPSLRVSKSDDPATHGRKLYTVYAKLLHWDEVDENGRPSLARSKTYLPALSKAVGAAQPGGLKRGTVAVDQVIVKEAWHFSELSHDEFLAVQSKYKEGESQQTRVVPETGGRNKLTGPTYDHGGQLLPLAERYDEKSKKHRHYKGISIAGLFIMAKLDPQTPGTDAGWIYGTVDADLRTVTGIGKMESCMKCHKDAPHDRLFGLP